MPPSVEEELLSTIHASPPPDAYDYGAPDNYEPGSARFGAEDAARLFEESYLGRNQKHKDSLKRGADGADSDESSDLEIPASSRNKPAAKKRKVDKDSASIADEFERSVGGISPSKFASSKAKGKGKQNLLREASTDSVVPSSTPKGRKRGGGGKKLLPPDTLEGLGIGSAGASVAGDITPSASRPVSPALTATSVVYELDEIVPPLKRAKKIDENAMAKRLKNLEEAQKKVWTNIARRDIAKVCANVASHAVCTLISLHRCTSMPRWATRLVKVSSSAWPRYHPSKHVDLSRRPQKLKRTCKPKANA